MTTDVSDCFSVLWLYIRMANFPRNVPSKVKTPIHHNKEAQNNKMDQTGSLEEDIFFSSFPVHKLQSGGFGGLKRWRCGLPKIKFVLGVNSKALYFSLLCPF